ncbi:MAG: hypothetical protein K6F14_02245 [Clostridiales bacterium]|nr:hypothetical protein [Clostridiales bacterium]
MSRFKKIVSSLLAVLILTAVMLSFSSVSAMKHPGRIDGVDYTRINENKDLRIEVEFQLGTTKFKGELTNGSTLSNDEIDQIIKQVMNQMEMTSGKLEYSKAVIEKAKHLKGFDPAMALRIGLNVAGFGTVADIYDMYTGTKEITDVTANFVIGQLSGEAVKFITGAKWADIALNAFLATKDIAEEWTRLENEKEIAEQAMQRELLLEMFYRECNTRLKKAEEARGGNQWKLKVNDSKYKQKTLFGVEVGQIQWLKVDMQRVDSFGDDSSTNWSGVYEGSIVLQIWHDLDNFDQNFPNIFANSNAIFKKLQTIYDLRPESAKEKSSLTKIITLSNAQIYIDKRNAIGTTLTKQVPLAGAEDVSAFNLAHKVTFALGIRPWNDGSLDITGTGVHYSAKCTMEEDCSGTMLDGNRYPAIMWNSHEAVAYDSLSAPMGVGWTHRNLVANGKTTIGCPALADYQIYSELRDNMLTLWIKNIDKVVGQ